MLQRGTLQRKHEFLSADKTKKGLEMPSASKASEPGPGSYSPRVHEQRRPNNTEKKQAMKGSTFISNLKSTGLNLTTVPSIPSKSQLLVIHP